MIVITTMDVLPDYCYDCPCNNGEHGRCEADKEKRSTFEYRPYWCPLKEQERGRWIPVESPTGIEAFGIKEMTVMDVRCSVCGSEEDVSFTGYKYCPRCGAKMEGR